MARAWGRTFQEAWSSPLRLAKQHLRWRAISSLRRFSRPARIVPRRDGMGRRRPILYYNEDMMAHTMQWPHQEKATRAQHAFDHLAQKGLIGRCEVLPGRPATDEELLSVHTARHVDEVKRLPSGRG